MPAYDKMVVTDDMMMEEGNVQEPCVMCGTYTGWMSLFFEAPICSTECGDKLYSEWVDAFNEGKEARA